MEARRSTPNRATCTVGLGRYEWSIASEVGAIDPVVDELVEICWAAGLSGRQCRLNVPVAVTEAISNAVLSGNCGDRSLKVRIAVLLDSLMLTIDVTDEGNGFDPAASFRGPDDEGWLEGEGGRGLFVMRALMDEVLYNPAGIASGGHTVRLILRRS